MIFLIVLILLLKYKNFISINYIDFNNNIFNINKTYNYNIINKINIGTFTYYLENGGRARVTSFILNYLYKIKIFNLYLFTSKKKDNNEYFIEKNINRILINEYTINNLIKYILKKRINIFIYQFSDSNEINALNQLKKS